MFNDFDSILNEIMAYGAFPTIASTETESGKDSKGNWKRTTMKTNDGRVQVTYFTRDSTSESKISSLQNEMKRAVDIQDFEKALILRDQIKELQKMENMVMDLEGELKEAVKKQNFERAIELRDELKKLKTN